MLVYDMLTDSLSTVHLHHLWKLLLGSSPSGIEIIYHISQGLSDEQCYVTGKSGPCKHYNYCNLMFTISDLNPPRENLLTVVCVLIWHFP